MNAAPRWNCLSAARARTPAARLPLHLIDAGARVPVGSVAREHLPALADLASGLHLGSDTLTLDLPDAAARSAWFAPLNRRLRDAGLIRAWRDETYTIVTAQGAAPLAHIERAAARFWGTLTFGAHCNGFVADAAGRPTHLWIARRSPHKPTDPGLLDNLVGGGVPHDQTPFETLVREGWEEAGMTPERMRHATPGAVFRLVCEIREGLQVEDLHVFDLALAPHELPQNQDGEVAGFRCLPVAEALECAARGEMTVDAALVTLDFGLRHGLVPAAEQGALQAAADALRLAADSPLR